MIRPALASDLDAIVAMGARFITETPYRWIALNPAQLRETAGWLLSSPDRVILVSERGGALVGMIGLACYPHPFSGERIAGELFWWVEPEHRGGGVRLLKAAEVWAKAAGARRLQMVAPSPAVADMYRRLGFAEVEQNFDREL